MLHASVGDNISLLLGLVAWCGGVLSVFGVENYHFALHLTKFNLDSFVKSPTPNSQVQCPVTRNHSTLNFNNGKYISTALNTQLQYL